MTKITHESAKMAQALTDKEQFKKLKKSFTGYKAAFTRVEGVNERLVEYAPTVATAQTTSELEKALKKIEEQYDKLQDCSEELMEVGDDDDELKEINQFLDRASNRYERNRSLILDMISRHERNLWAK